MVYLRVMTRNDLDNAVQAALGPHFSVSVDYLPEMVSVTVSCRWWAIPLWWVRKRGALAVIDALRPEGVSWTLERR